MDPRPLRLVAWNILHGGGPARTPAIGLAVTELKADLVVLTEFRTARGGQIRAQLADAGLEHQAVSPGGEGRNGVLIASRERLQEIAPPDATQGRWLHVRVEAWDLEVCGVHVPDDGNLGRKSAFWQHLILLARGANDRNLAILGDFNTGRRGEDGSRFACEALLGTLLSLGFVDAWRRLHPDGREMSWEGMFGKGRIDTAYLSPPLGDALLSCEYDHGVRERGLSDHSAVVATLNRARREAETQRAGLFAP